MVGVIAYGSLFPFRFRVPAGPEGPVRAILQTWNDPQTRGNLIANLLFYLPFGFFAARALGRIPAFARIALVAAAGLALSLGMELTQFYIPGRDSTLTDVYDNFAGSLLGAALGSLFHGELRLGVFSALTKRPFPALLIACWAGYRLFPYAPVIDLHKYWRAVRPLLVSPHVARLDLYRHAVICLALALLMEALFGAARGRLAILIFVLGLLSARILIFGNILSPAEVVGEVLAAAIWAAVLWRLPLRAPAVALLFMGVIVIDALAPFRFSAAARPFGWVPFLSFLQGSYEVNIRSFFEKAFTYGALVWLSVRAGCRLRSAVAAGGIFVFLLRLAQTYLPGRSAEITDVIMLLALAAIMKLMEEEPGKAAQMTNEISGKMKAQPVGLG